MGISLNSSQRYSNTAEDFLAGCNSCGKCVNACPFLETHGTPYEILNNSFYDVFYCTNCQACNNICPEGLCPSEIFLQTKQRLIKENSIPETARFALKSAYSFTIRGHKFPFSHYPSIDTVFWPGCSLAGVSPEIVKKTMVILSRHLNKKVGLLLDCCFDPLYQMGDMDKVKEASLRIKERLKRHKIHHVIVGCVNCRKMFSLYMPEIRVEHVLEILPETTNPPSPPFAKGGEITYLHHPCPSHRFEEIREKAKRYLNTKESAYPLCCGNGGGLSSLDKPLSEKFINKLITESNGSPIVTYCMGCKDRLIRKGKNAEHILEGITNTQVKKPVSPLKKWKNRFLLSISQKIKSKKLIAGLIILLLIILVIYMRKTGSITPESIMGFIQKHSMTAPVLFILIYAIGPSLFIPSLPFTLGAGFLWGPFFGVLFSITGATLGASVSFLISRYIIGDTIKERFSHARWKWLKERVEKHGWKAVAFTRIVPIFPYPVLNYLFGVTPIPFLHYLWATLIFMLPACIAYTAFGHSMGELILKGNIKGVIFGILIATVAMIIPFVLKPLFKKLDSHSPIKDFKDKLRGNDR